MTEASTRRKHKRPRPQTSCAVCHRRKVRCNNELPCGPCIRHGCPDDCRFDGIPAKNEPKELSEVQADVPSATSSDTGARSSKRSRIDESNTDFLSLLSQDSTSSRAVEKERSLRLSEESNQINPPHRVSSRLPTHDWISDLDPIRGRTHTSWLLNAFDPLLVYLGKNSHGDDPLREDDTWMNKNRELDPLPQAHQFAGSVYDELPSKEICHDLVARYFETFDTIYPIIDRNIFATNFYMMHGDPKSVPICFVIKTLVIMAIANSTYPAEKAPISKPSTAKWMDLASSLPASALEAGDVRLHTATTFAILSLAEQLLKLDATAAYVRSGHYVRTAMALGLHRVETAGEKRRLWDTIMDLDLHASLAAGTTPSTLALAPIDNAVEKPAESDADALSLVISRSLPVRHKIVTVLNSEKHLRFEQVVELSSELTKAMAPVSTSENRSDDQKSFLYRYLSFTYGRFLAALHRPFFMLNDPAFYLSRSMITRLAKQYMKEIIAVYKNKAGSDSFAALLVSNGIMFRNEARQAHMALCYELLRGDGGLDVHSFLGSSEEGKGSVNKVFREFFGIAESKVKKKEIPESSFLIPAMVYAHMCAIERFPRDSNGYAEALTHAAVEAEGFLPAREQSTAFLAHENAF